MLKFRGRFSFPKFDKEKYSKTLEQKCLTEIRNAARAWLKAAYPHVPVWTGMARASFQTLASDLRIGSLGIVPSPTAPKNRVAEGQALGSFKFEKREGRFLFHFETKVPHFVELDQNPASPGLQRRLKNETPWNSFQAGDAAFVEYIQQNLAGKLPKVKDFIKFGHQIIT